MKFSLLSGDVDKFKVLLSLSHWQKLCHWEVGKSRQAWPSWFVPFKHRKAAPLREEFLNCEQKATQEEYLYSRWLVPGLLWAQSLSDLICDSFRTQNLCTKVTNSKRNREFSTYQSRVLKVFTLLLKTHNAPSVKSQVRVVFHTLNQYISYCKVNQQENRDCFLW